MTETKKGKTTFTFGCLIIEKSLLKLKAVFFLFFIGSGVITPFLSIFLKNLGLHATEAGIIGGILPLLVFPIRPLIVALGERFGIRKVVLVASFLLFMASRICFLEVPPNPHPPQLQMVSKGNNSGRSGICLSKNSQIVDCTSLCASDSDVTSFFNSSQLDNFFYCKRISQSPIAYISENSKTCPFQNDSQHDLVTLEIITMDIPLLNNSRLDKDGCAIYSFDVFAYKAFATSYLNYTCDNDVSWQCSRHPVKNAAMEEEERIFGITFWISFVLFFLSSLAEFLIVSGIDALAYDQMRGTNSTYGLQRVMGSIGYALAALPAAFILDASTGQGKGLDFTIPVYAGSGIILLCAIVVCTLRIPSQARVKNLSAIFFKVVSSAEVVVFFCVSAFLGAMHQLVEVFVFWYLKELGSLQLTMGLAIVMRTVGELVCLPLSGIIIRRIGEIRTLYISIFANVLRFGAYSFLTNPWYVLPIEPLHGFTFCLMWAATSYHASIIAPPAILFTFQSLLGGIIIGFGGGSGVLLTGYLFDKIGPIWTFRAYSLTSFVVLILFVVLQTFVFRSSRARTSEYSEKESEINGETVLPLKDADTNEPVSL